MAKLDEIKALIHKAQAEAVRNTPSLSAASSGAAVKESQNIVAQKAAKHGYGTSGQAETLAQPVVTDTGTTQQKYDNALKEYDGYIGSDEYKQKQAENNRVALHEAMQRIFGAGSSAHEQELQTAVEHYKQQMNTGEDQRVRDNDMTEINAMPNEDREQLRQYIENLDKNNEVTGRDNLFLGLIRGINLDKSKKALTEKYGAEKVDQLASTYSRYLKEEQAKQVETDTRAAVQENPWAQQIPGAVNRLLGGQQAAADRFAEMFSRDDRYSTLAPYVAGDLISLQGSTVTGETANMISGDQYGENGQMIHDGGVLRQGAAYLYQGGMSMVDSFMRAAAGGGATGGAALAACNAFSQTVSQATQQGASPDQAYKLGAAVAGVEYLSEKIPMDEVFKLAKGGKTNVLMQAFKQAGVEITTEELSLLGSMAAEAAILQEKSSYKQQIGDLVANGASYEEAKAQANKGVWEEVKQTAFVSGIAGGLSGGGAAYVGNLTANNVAEVTAEAQQEQSVQTPPTVPVVEPAQQTGPSAEQLLEGIQDMTPAPAPLTEEQQHFDNAAAIANGIEPSKQMAEPLADESTVINTNPAQHTPQEQATIDAYQKSVDDNLVEYIEAVRNNPGQRMPRYSLNNVNDRAALDIRRLTGIDVSGNKTEIEARTVEHILKRHGENGNADHSMRDVNDIARIQYVIDNYDSMENGGTTGAYRYQDESGKQVHSQTVLIKKKVNGTYFVVEAVPDTKKKTLYVLSAYMNKNGQKETASSLVGDAEAYRVTSETKTKSDTVLNNSIPQNGTEVNGNSTPESDDYDEFESWGVDPNREGVENPLSDRSYSEVGKRSVKAYMYENPAVKPFYQEQAAWLLSELADSTKGERTYNEQLHYESGGEQGWSGTKRHTSESIAELLDQDGMSYDQIERGLNAIVNDHGQENNAVSKRIEFVINDRLMNGYTDFYTGQKVPGNAEYLNLLRNQQSASDVDTSEAVQMGASNIQQQSTEGRQGIKGTGAAEENFSNKPAYNATLAEDNAQADRRDDIRPMELPDRDINGGNISAVTGNVYGSKITPDDFASLMEEPTAKGDFTYAKITNDQATQRATETIASAGTWENAYDSWKQSVTSGNAGAEMSARGALFLNHAVQQGNKQLWLETLHYMQKLGTNTAQGLQAFRIIRTLKPVDKIEFVKISVEKMATEVKEKHGIDLEIDQTLIDEFEQAETDEDRNAVLEDIQQNVADQIPSTFLDKWTALRYMNMLGNLKTNVRNVAGNIGSAAVYRIKDTIATGMEAIASKVSGGESERTKSLFVRKSLLDACKEDFQQFKETVSSGGKYGERMSATSQFAQGVQDKRRIFNNPALEAYRKGTNWMMNNEYFGDEAFGRAAYSRALAGYLQANGVTGSDLSKVDSTLLDKSRAYAVKEAQEATFHDNSALAKIVSKVQKDTGFVGQAIMPFTKTPANVLTRAEEFSPLGLINSTVKSIQKARGKEDISGADVINSWAKSITGVGLFALGAAMMDQGLFTGGPDEDEEKAAFDELNGQQNYAIQLPNGTNYTIDWLTPAAMPMFMGAQFWKMLSSNQDLTFADMEQVFTSIADPMIQMSMLQGLNDSLDGIKYSDNNLGQFFINSAVSYLTQGLTNTLMGQLERSTEENRQTTYVDKDSNTPEWLQRQLGKASQKIPGWDYQQGEYLDAWGQTEKNEGGLLYNLLSPGYISKEHSDMVSKELYRLREATGENVFPQTVEKTVNYTDTDGNQHTGYNLSQKELETMQKVEGQTAARLMVEVMTNEDYNSLTDAQRAAVISNVYKYAQEQGKKEALTGYYSEAAAWLQNMGDDAANGLIQRAALSTINSSVTKIVDNIENEWAVSPAAQQELDGLYDSYAGMSEEARKQILDEAISDTVKYLEIRSKGLDTTQYLDVVGDIKALEVEPNFSDIRDIQIREAIAENGSLSTREKDIVMRAYMPDYDSTAKSPQTTELKYDAIRELGVSPEGYTAAYRDYLDASGSGKRRRTIAQYRKDYGWDQATAQKVYDIYAGYYKPWEE